MPEELYNKLSFNHPTNMIISSLLYNFHHASLMSLNELDLKTVEDVSIESKKKLIEFRWPIFSWAVID